MSRGYNVYFVDGAMVKTLETKMDLGLISTVSKWKHSKPDRMVYTTALSIPVWYQLSGARNMNARWNELKAEPKIIQMAKLIDAIGETTIQEIKDAIQVDTFFD
jgi:hypothetical protein